MSEFFATLWTVCNLPDSSVHGISLTGILEWVAISFLRGFSWHGLNLRFLHWQADSLPLNHQGSSIFFFFLWIKKLCEQSLSWQVEFQIFVFFSFCLMCVCVCVCVFVFLRWTKATYVHTLKISTLVITLSFNTHVATSWLISCFKGSAYPVFWDALKMADMLHFGGLFSSLPISGSGPLPACSGSLFLSSGLSFLGLCPSSHIKIGTTLPRLNREHASWLHHTTD